MIADPDILTFDLADHKPQFLVLASDGLWDTFSNEEAISFIKERLGEPHFGAKSITLQSYYRGNMAFINCKRIHRNSVRYVIWDVSYLKCQSLEILFDLVVSK